MFAFFRKKPDTGEKTRGNTGGQALEDAVRRLRTLLDEHTRFSETGFSIDLCSAPEDWDACSREIGVDEAYRLMAEHLCGRFREKFGDDFLFSDRCVEKEIAYHMNAFMRVRGFPGYRRHLTTYAFNKDYIVRHCKEIDISTEDVKDWCQRKMFRYRKGIRDCYKGTSRDPFGKKTAK